MATLLVADLLKEKQGDLALSVLAGAKGVSRPITVSEINRPGLALSGYLDYFPSERVQIMGLGEHSYLATLSAGRRGEVLEKVFSYNKNLPCIVTTRGLKPHPEVIRISNRLKLPLIRSG